MLQTHSTGVDIKNYSKYIGSYYDRTDRKDTNVSIFTMIFVLFFIYLSNHYPAEWTQSCWGYHYNYNRDFCHRKTMTLLL